MATRYNEDFKIEVVKAYMAGDRSMSEISKIFFLHVIGRTMEQENTGCHILCS